MSNSTHNALLTTVAIVSAAYSAAFLLAPAQLQNLFGLKENLASVWLARIAGAAVLGYAALALFARHVDNAEARRAIDGAFLVSWAGTLGILMWQQYLQVMNSFGWINVAVAAAFSIAFFYFLAAEDRVEDLMAARARGRGVS